MSNKTPRPASTGQRLDQSRSSPPRRRSARLSANEENLPPKDEAPCVMVKRSITVRKIVPRKTQAPSEPNKENVERRSSGARKRSQAPSPTQTEAPAPKPTVLSPIQAPSSPPRQPRESEQDPVWSNKVRRSYSRLSMGDRSFVSSKPQSGSSSPTRRETLFGFERLQTPEVIRKADVSRGALQTSSLCGGSLNLSAADDSVSHTPEPDMNIPGICLAKKNPRRKRVQQIKMSELDVLAAKMNAEFDEAETFELVIE